MTMTEPVLPGNPIFGNWGDAPVAEPPVIQIQPPVGHLCLYCELPIELHDVGMMILDGVSGERAPIHRDCLLAWVLGKNWRR
jgi:hypothetical protein